MVGDLVDFGDAKEAIADDAGMREAAFRFSIRDLHANFYSTHYSFDDYYRHRRVIRVSLARIRYVIGAIEDRTVLKTIETEIPEEDIKVRLELGESQDSKGGIDINGYRPEFLLKNYDVRADERSLFSPPLFVARAAEKEEGIRRALRAHTVLAATLKGIFDRWVTRKLSDETLWKESRRVLATESLDTRTIERLRDSASTVTFGQIYSRLLSAYGGELKEQVFAIQRLARVLAVLGTLEEELTTYFLNVGYLEPVRAAGERYYRKQELEVSEIAPNGSNFAMFLASLTARDLSRFSEWVQGLFGYGIKVQRTGGHISIQLHSGSKSVNVTDTGYGVSQILPVLGMIWWAQRRDFVSRAPRRRQHGLRTLAIEQPELHLHPAHQARLADAFVAGIRGGEGERREGSEIRLVVETHSEALINRLGELVEEGKIDAQAIQIVTFSAQEDLNSPTEVCLSEFDGSGALVDWPYGFFKYS